MGKKGFTLIELLVVIAIISLLSSVVMSSLNSARVKARDARRKVDLKQLQLALELYYDSNAGYPNTGGALWSEGRCDPGGPGWPVKPDYSGSNAYIPNLAPDYIPVLPGDPAPATTRCYLYSGNGATYIMAAHFGAEGSFSSSDPMIRLVAPACTTAQNTFTIVSEGSRCW